MPVSSGMKLLSRKPKINVKYMPEPKTKIHDREPKNCGGSIKDKTMKQISIDIAKHPKIHEALIKSAEANFRTIEQHALYYIWTALNIEENGEK